MYIRMKYLCKMYMYMYIRMKNLCNKKTLLAYILLIKIFIFYFFKNIRVEDKTKPVNYSLLYVSVTEKKLTLNRC